MTPQEIQQLLAKGDILGQQASVLSGRPYTPVLSQQTPRTLDTSGSNQPLNISNQPAGSAPDQAPGSSVFGQALMGLLKQYQTLGTRPYAEQQFNLQEGQAKASTAGYLDPSLKGYAPSTIFASGQAAAAPYGPAIQGAQQSRQTYGEQIRSFGDVLNTARQFQQDLLGQEEKGKADAANIVNLALTTGGSAGLEALIKANPNILKKAGMDANTIQSLIPSIKAKEAEEKRRFDVKQLTDTGLTPSQLQTAIDRVSDDFRQDPIVKQYTQALPGYQFLKSINPNTTNPADDIGLIYAFAKIMDPESVVREGEYATVQKYANSWAQTFGFNSARIFSNTKFLSSQAVKNMQSTAAARFKALEDGQTSARKTYQNRIDDLKAGKVGIGELPNYGTNNQTSGGQDPINEVKGDIQQAVSSKDYGTKYKTREDLINALVSIYPELTLDQIAAQVYSLIPDIK